MHYQGANLPITFFWRSKLTKNWHPVGRINGWQGAVVGKLARLLRKITDFIFCKQVPSEVHYQGANLPITFFGTPKLTKSWHPVVVGKLGVGQVGPLFGKSLISFFLNQSQAKFTIMEPACLSPSSWRSKLKKNWHPVGRIHGWQGAVVGKLACLSFL